MAIPILSSIFGEKPNIADYIPTIFSEEQMKSIQENLKAFPEISRLGSAYYDYMMGSMTKAIPQFANILKAGGETTAKMLSTAGEELAGIVPQDVQDQLRRSTAFTNLMAGTAGAPMGAANQARNLGLTSLDMIQKGAALQGEAGNAAQRWAGLASGLIMSPSGFMVTPEQQAKLTMQNNLYKQATQQLRYNVAAAPDPIAKGLSDIVENLTAAYLGGKVGKIGAGNEAATQAAGTGFRSDVSNPGYYTDGGGGGGVQDLSAATSFDQPYTSQLTTTSQIPGNPFESGYSLMGATGGYMPPASSDFLSLSPTGTSDFWGFGSPSGGWGNFGNQYPTNEAMNPTMAPNAFGY